MWYDYAMTKTNKALTKSDKTLNPLGEKWLKDTEGIAVFMETFGQQVSTELNRAPRDAELELRGRLALEEVFELSNALGLMISIDGEEFRHVNPKSVRVKKDPNVDYDPVETLDALADTVVVIKGAALQFGLPVDEAIVDVVMPSNMSKLTKDGEVLMDAGGKVLKSDQFIEPNLAPLIKKD